MFFSAQRQRVAHALHPSTVRDALKGAKKSLKARFKSTRSASPPTCICGIAPEIVTSTHTPQLPDSCDPKIAPAVNEEAPQAVASLVVPTPDKLNVMSFPFPSRAQLTVRFRRSTSASKRVYTLPLALHHCTCLLPSTAPSNASLRLRRMQMHRRHMSQVLISSPHVRSP